MKKQDAMFKKCADCGSEFLHRGKHNIYCKKCSRQHKRFFIKIPGGLGQHDWIDVHKRGWSRSNGQSRTVLDRLDKLLVFIDANFKGRHFTSSEVNFELGARSLQLYLIRLVKMGELGMRGDATGRRYWRI